jgi:hypothetical protein
MELRVNLEFYKKAKGINDIVSLLMFKIWWKNLNLL